MALGPYSRIAIRRPSGKVEMIGRAGIHDPDRIARQLRQAGAGEVISVRHERVAPTGKRETMAVHRVGR